MAAYRQGDVLLVRIEPIPEGGGRVARKLCRLGVRDVSRYTSGDWLNQAILQTRALRIET
jgi:hypothetical protein